MAESSAYQKQKEKLIEIRKELNENIEEWKDIYKDEFAGVEGGLNTWLADIDTAIAKFDSDDYKSPLDRKNFMDFEESIVAGITEVKKHREADRDTAAKAVETKVLGLIRDVMCKNIDASLLSADSDKKLLERAKLLGFAVQVDSNKCPISSTDDAIGLRAKEARDGSYYFIDNSIVPGNPSYGKPLFLKDKNGNLVTTFKYDDDPQRKKDGLIKMTDDEGNPYIVVDKDGNESDWNVSKEKAYDFVLKNSTLQDVIDGKKGLDELAGHETFAKIVNGEDVSDAEKEEMLTAIFRQLVTERETSIENDASLSAEQKWDMERALEAFYPELEITKKGVLNEKTSELLRQESKKSVKERLATTIDKFDSVLNSTLQDFIDGKKGLDKLAGHETFAKIISGADVSDVEKEKMLTAVFRQLATECETSINNDASLSADQKADMNEILKTFYPELEITRKGVLSEKTSELLIKKADKEVGEKLATTMDKKYPERLSHEDKKKLDEKIDALAEKEYESKVKQIEEKSFDEMFDAKIRPLKMATDQTKTLSEGLAYGPVIELFKKIQENEALVSAGTKGSGFYESVIEQLDEDLIRQQLAKIDEMSKKIQEELSFTDGLFAGDKESIYSKLEGMRLIKERNEIYKLNDLDEEAMMAGAIRVFGDDFQEQLDQFIKKHDDSRASLDKKFGDGEEKYADLDLHHQIEYFVEDYVENAKDNYLREVSGVIAEELIGKTDGLDTESEEADRLFEVYGKKAYSKLKEVAEKSIKSEEKEAEEKTDVATGDRLGDSPAPDVTTATSDGTHLDSSAPSVEIASKVGSTEGKPKVDVGPKPVDDKRKIAEERIVKTFDELLSKDGIDHDTFEKVFYDDAIVNGFMSGESKDYSEELATHFTDREKRMAEGIFKDLPKKVKDIDKKLASKELDDETYGKLILQREIRGLLEKGKAEKNSGFEKQVYSSPSQQAWILRQARERLEAKRGITKKVSDLEKEKGELKIVSDTKKEKKKHDKKVSKAKSKVSVGGFSSADSKLKQLEKVCGYIDKLYAGTGVMYSSSKVEPPKAEPDKTEDKTTVTVSVRHTKAVRDMACDVVWESMFRTVEEKFDEKYKGYIGKKNMAMVALASGHFPATDKEAMEKFGITKAELMGHMQTVLYETRKNKMIRDTIRDVMDPKKGVKIEGVTSENVNTEDGKKAVEAWVTAQLGVLAGTDKEGRYQVEKDGKKSLLLPDVNDRGVARYVLNEVLKGQNNPSDIRLGDKDLDDRRKNNHLYNALGRAGWSIDLEQTMCDIEERIRENSVKDPEGLLGSLEKDKLEEKEVEFENGEHVTVFAKEIDGQTVYIDPKTNSIISSEKTETKDADNKNELTQKIVNDHLEKVKDVKEKTQDQIKQGKESLAHSDFGL